MVDPCGTVPILIPIIIGLGTGFGVGVGIATTSNHKENNNNKEQIYNELKASYTKDEAKKEIESLLAGYGEGITVTFYADNVKISNSYLVSSKYDRQKVCAIIARTDNCTERTVGDMAAEWNAHNKMYYCPWWKEKCQDVNLDYDSDSRWTVNFATGVFEFLGWE